jgi:hypothetical protein
MFKIFLCILCALSLFVSCASNTKNVEEIIQIEFAEVEVVVAEETEIDVPDERIKLILGINYKIDETLHTVDYYGTIYRWYHIDLLGQTLDINRFHRISVAEIFGTDTGDALFVLHDDDAEYLYIDVGEARGQRGYSIFKLAR